MIACHGERVADDIHINAAVIERRQACGRIAGRAAGALRLRGAVVEPVPANGSTSPRLSGSLATLRMHGLATVGREFFTPAIRGKLAAFTMCGPL